MAKLTRPELQWLRAAAQHLFTPESSGAAACVAGMGALQAQEKPSSLLALRPRLRGITAQDVEAALNVERTLVRTWCLRGTLHLVASDDVRWLLELISQRVLAGRRRRYQQLGFDEEIMETACNLIAMGLRENGQMTRVELGDFLERMGVRNEGQRLPHLLGRAALLGMICFGPDQDGAETYVLLDEWLGPEGKQPEHGWETLAVRYLASYGPASPTDFAKWSGARIGEARAAFAAQQSRLAEVTYEGESLWIPKTQLAVLTQKGRPELPIVRLIAAYDPLLLGYKSRDWLVEAAFADEIHPGGGFIRPTITMNGAAVGTWRLSRSGDGRVVIVKPFVALPPSGEEALLAEVEDIGRFLDQAVTMEVS